MQKKGHNTSLDRTMHYHLHHYLHAYMLLQSHMSYHLMPLLFKLMEYREWEDELQQNDVS